MDMGNGITRKNFSIQADNRRITGQVIRAYMEYSLGNISRQRYNSIINYLLG